MYNHFLLSGSLAYDTILMHKGHFHQKILPEELTRLNVAFGIDGVNEEFGGTAGNIAYNSALLHDVPWVVSSVGEENLSKYLQHLEKQNIPTQNLNVCGGERMAQAWLMTDQINNQIIGFFPGAMVNRAVLPEKTPELWHLSPDYSPNMLYLAQQAQDQNKTYFIDPGQDIVNLFQYTNQPPCKHSSSFFDAIYNATGLFVNEYESLLIKEKFELNDTFDDLFFSKKLKFIVQTMGSEGSYLITKNSVKKFSVAKAEKIVDPTGCGDAFRAGFIHQFLKGDSLDNCMKMGAVMGSFAIESSGGQNHKPDYNKIVERSYHVGE